MQRCLGYPKQISFKFVLGSILTKMADLCKKILSFALKKNS
jgi:hypothetical protein